MSLIVSLIVRIPAIFLRGSAEKRSVSQSSSDVQSTSDYVRQNTNCGHDCFVHPKWLLTRAIRILFFKKRK